MIRYEMRDGDVMVRWDGDETIIRAAHTSLTRDELAELIHALQQALDDRDAFAVQMAEAREDAIREEYNRRRDEAYAEEREARGFVRDDE